jgi:hypothetical protein
MSTPPEALGLVGYLLGKPREKLLRSLKIGLEAKLTGSVVHLRMVAEIPQRIGLP